VRLFFASCSRVERGEVPGAGRLRVERIFASVVFLQNHKIVNNSIAWDLMAEATEPLGSAEANRKEASVSYLERGARFQQFFRRGRSPEGGLQIWNGWEERRERRRVWSPRCRSKHNV